MKRAIIIGATSGIGRELTKVFALNGFEVGIVGRRGELLDSLASELSVKACPLVLDISKVDEAIRTFEEYLCGMQDVDVVVIGAGTGHINDLLEWSYEKETIDTNVLGFTSMAIVAMRYFIKRGSGHLVGISSIAGIRGGGAAPAYNASKAYISNYLQGLRQKVAKRRLPITVTDVCPGFVDTQMAKGEGLFWVAPSEKAARQIYDAIKRKKKMAYITKRWKLIALLLKILPDFIYHKM